MRIIIKNINGYYFIAGVDRECGFRSFNTTSEMSDELSLNEECYINILQNFGAEECNFNHRRFGFKDSRSAEGCIDYLRLLLNLMQKPLPADKIKPLGEYTTTELVQKILRKDRTLSVKDFVILAKGIVEK